VLEGDGVWVCGLQSLRSVSNPAMETQLCVTRGKDCIVRPTSGMNKGPLWPCQILPTAELLLCTEGSGPCPMTNRSSNGCCGEEEEAPAIP